VCFRPGGLLIFETPNPQNVFVGSCNFYLDPTYRKPIPSILARVLAEEKGFAEIQILEPHAHEETFLSKWSSPNS
jgi:hypothetical protein